MADERKGIKGRYRRNIGTITPEENRRLADCTVCVAGCGGLGGGVIECLTRLGVGRIKAVDADVFDETNLNRQILSHQENLGKSKAYEAAEQMARINGEVEVIPIQARLDAENGSEILADCQAAVDALDNVHSRKILEQVCRKRGIPLIHGAIAGWRGQVAVIPPGRKLMEQLYPGGEDAGEELDTGNPSFTPAVVSAIQAAETVKVLLGRAETLADKLLTVDLLEHQYDIIEFGEEPCESL